MVCSTRPGRVPPVGSGLPARRQPASLPSCHRPGRTGPLAARQGREGYPGPFWADGGGTLHHCSPKTYRARPGHGTVQPRTKAHRRLRPTQPVGESFLSRVQILPRRARYGVIPLSSKNFDQKPTARSRTSLKKIVWPPGSSISRREISKPRLKPWEKAPPLNLASAIRGGYLEIFACFDSVQMSCK